MSNGGKVSHSTLDIQKELARQLGYEAGLSAGKAALRTRAEEFLTTEANAGRETVPIALMKRMLEMWT